MQAIRWKQSQGNPSECAAQSVELLPRKSESRRLTLPWYGIRCVETVTTMVTWSISANERKEYLALLRKLPTSSAYFEEMRLKAKGNWASYWLFDDFVNKYLRTPEVQRLKLIRLTALVLRAVKNFKTGTRGEEPNGLLSTGEYALEEILWIREMQQSVIKSHKFKELKQQLALLLTTESYDSI